MFIAKLAKNIMHNPTNDSTSYGRFGMFSNTCLFVGFSV